MKTLERFQTSNGIACHRSGEGAAIVLVHGVGLRAESFGWQIAFLEKTYSVFAIDVPGHGESPGFDATCPGLGEYTARLKGFIDEVIGEPVMLVGHSMGAMIVVDFARRFPQHCRGVVALNAVHRRAADVALAVQQRAAALKQGDAGDVVSAPVRRWFGECPRGFELKMARCCEKWLNQVDRAGYGAAYSVFANENGLSDAEFMQLDLPALFLTGAHDENSTPEMSHAMANLAPAGEAVIIANARHLVQLTHASEVNKVLGRFFEHCEGAHVGARLTTAGVK